MDGYIFAVVPQIIVSSRFGPHLADVVKTSLIEWKEQLTWVLAINVYRSKTAPAAQLKVVVTPSSSIVLLICNVTKL